MNAQGLVNVAPRQHETSQLARLALKRATWPCLVIEQLEISIFICRPAHAWHGDSGKDLPAAQTIEIVVYLTVAPQRIVKSIYRHKIIRPRRKGLTEKLHLNPHIIETARDCLDLPSEEVNIVTMHLPHERMQVSVAIHIYIIFSVSRKTAYEIAQMTRVFLYINQKSKFNSRIN